MESQKPAAKPAAKKEEKISNVRGIRSAFAVICLCFVVALCVFIFVLGNPDNFEGGDTANHPLNLLGTIYHGGFIVPILQTLFLTVIVLFVERWIAISSAQGKGNTSKFVADIKGFLAKNEIDKAMARCKDQKGSVASVVYNTLVKYKEMDANTQLSKEQKLTTLRNEVEEATALEMPSLTQNLPVVASLTTLGTLVGLLGQNIIKGGFIHLFHFFPVQHVFKCQNIKLFWLNAWLVHHTYNRQHCSFFCKSLT